MSISMIYILYNWDLKALSAHTDYIIPLKNILQLKSEINEKYDNITCWEYIQQT